ncbi:serine/threonine-protein kinase D-like [Montipora capricornis]|uniref:serine/threonine-protein kinase D-like n=1 Tax=Montipora capricornis TaxID=246305 RepID=UPI0035F11355
MVVAVKELKVLGHSQQEIVQQRKEVIHEATIMLRLGDHRGLPLLFGIQSKVTPFRIIMQFHGINDKSLTIRRAVRKIKLSNEEWKTVVDLVGRALQFIHSKGVLHNDLKGDNILLERRKKHYNPVVIDFGKSTFIDETPKRKMCMSTKEQKEYTRGTRDCFWEVIL